MRSREFAVGHQETSIVVAGLVREASERWIVCLHGIQSNKELFGETFTQPWADPYSVLALDLVGFGKSSRPPSFSYDIADQAEVCDSILSGLGASELHLIGHSLGGMISIMLAHRAHLPVSSLINLEGNLTADDCGASRIAAGYSLDEFRDEYPSFVEKVRTSPEPSGPRRAQALADVPDYVFHQTSTSIVAWSESGEMRRLFAEAPLPRLFVHGERNAAKTKSLPPDIPAVAIPGTGHFMLAEQPETTLRAIGDFLGLPSKHGA